METDSSRPEAVIPSEKRRLVKPQRRRREPRRKNGGLSKRRWSLGRRWRGTTGSRSERESIVWLAQALPGRKAWEAGAGDQLLPVRVSEAHPLRLGSSIPRRFSAKPVEHDSHRTAPGTGHRCRLKAVPFRYWRTGVLAGVTGLPADARILDRGITDLRCSFTELSGSFCSEPLWSSSMKRIKGIPARKGVPNHPRWDPTCTRVRQGCLEPMPSSGTNGKWAV